LDGNNQMVSESMSNLLVWLVCYRHSPFYISHHNDGINDG